MTLGQQWAIVIAIIWAASMFAAYKLGHVRGINDGWQIYKEQDERYR